MSRALLVVALSAVAALEVQRIHVTEYLKDAAPLQEWRCDAQEDADLVLRHNSTVRTPKTFGFVLLAIGSKSVNESHHAVQCLHDAFDRAARQADVGVHVVEGTWADLGCGKRADMYGSLEAQRCFIQIQRVKFLLDRSAPFDLVMVMDTDMFAYPSEHSEELISKIFIRFAEWTSVDMMLAMAPQVLAVKGGGSIHEPFRWLNSGMLLFRKSDATDRFFACAMQTMLHSAEGTLEGRDHLPMDQDVINNNINYGPFLSVGLKTLGDDFQCRGKNPGEITDHLGCVFVHRHMTVAKSNSPTCPFPYKNREERHGS